MFDVQVTPTREPTSNNNAVDGRPPLPGKSKSGQQFYQSQQPQPHDSVNTPHTPIAFNNFGGSLQNIHQSSRYYNEVFIVFTQLRIWEKIFVVYVRENKTENEFIYKPS